jgi:hypothetical protein
MTARSGWQGIRRQLGGLQAGRGDNVSLAADLKLEVGWRPLQNLIWPGIGRQQRRFCQRQSVSDAQLGADWDCRPQGGSELRPTVGGERRGHTKTADAAGNEGKSAGRRGSRGERQGLWPAGAPIHYGKEVSETTRRREGTNNVDVNMGKMVGGHWYSRWRCWAWRCVFAR